MREKYIVLEFVEKGILKDFLLKAKFFSEKLAKIIVWKIFHAVSHMHEKGIIHNKISLESIILNRFYDFKIVGFEYAEFIQVNEDNHIMFQSDILSLAILIIQLLTGKEDLKWIKNRLRPYIQKGDFKQFWYIINIAGHYDFNPELKDLINTMLLGKIKNIKELLSHDWFDKVRESIKTNTFEEYERYMLSELKKYEGGENEF